VDFEMGKGKVWKVGAVEVLSNSVAHPGHHHFFFCLLPLLFLLIAIIGYLHMIVGSELTTLFSFLFPK
jgi:hypothetical protein